MAVSEIQLKTDAKATFTLTLASLANGSARQSTMITNTNKRPGALVTLKITSGAVAPTAGTTYDVFLLRGDDPASSTYRTDGAGAADAAITIENARRIGTIVVTATAAKAFYGEFDTGVAGPLGPEWGIAVRNNSEQALSSTETDHFKGYVAYVGEAQ